MYFLILEILTGTLSRGPHSENVYRKPAVTLKNSSESRLTCNNDLGGNNPNKEECSSSHFQDYEVNQRLHSSKQKKHITTMSCSQKFKTFSAHIESTD